LVAIGVAPEELQLTMLHERVRDRKSESADETDTPNGSVPGDAGEQPPEADQGSGASFAAEVQDEAAPDGDMGTTITLRGPGDDGGQPEAGQQPGAPPPEEVGPEETAPPAIAATALIASPSITGGADGDDPAPDPSQDLNAAELALDQAWDQHCTPSYDRLSDERRRRFIERKLGYLVVAPGSVAESGSEGGDA
jgi:hypothetical protein